MCVRDYYQGIIRKIMSDYDVKPRPTSPIVPANATFDWVLQHTDDYIGKGNDDKPGYRSHYRYRRYQEIIQLTKVPEGTIIHIDIGCGAGLFSWVLLDWAASNSIGYDRVDLYGFDHCQAMLKLAGMVRDELAQNVRGYPDLDYFNDTDTLLDQLTDDQYGETDYMVTFGHVLVQAHTPDAIENFTKIVVRIRDLMDERSTCSLIAVDVENAPSVFADAWNTLLQSLDRNRIRCDQQDVPVSPINDNQRAKWAILHPT